MSQSSSANDTLIPATESQQNSSVPQAAAGWRRLLTQTSPLGIDLGLLVVRASFGLALALAHGYGKLVNPERFIQGLTTRGFPLPGFFGWAAIVSEFVGGLLLALGLLTRPAAALVLVTLSVAAFDVHADDPFKKKELALAYAVVGLALLVTGAGRLSLDQHLFGPKHAKRNS